MTKKILIVYDNFGSGHKIIAEILENMINKAGLDVQVKKVTCASFADSPNFNFLVKSQNSLLKSNWVRLANFIVQKSTRYFSLPFLDISLDKKAYFFLETEKPDMIIATVGGFSKALGFYAQSHNVPFFIFVTNILPSNIDDLYPNAHHLVFFEESRIVGQSFDPNLTYFKEPIGPSDNWKKNFVYILNYFKDIYLKKIPIYHSVRNSGTKKNNFKFTTLGLFSEKKHFRPVEKTNISSKLDLTKDRPTVLVASGSGGGKIINKIIKDILLSKVKVNILAISGKDEKTFDQIEKLSRANPQLKIVPLAFVDNMNELLAIADLAIIRASATTLLECLIHKTPVMFPLPIISNDTGCQEMVEKYNLGRTFWSKDFLSIFKKTIEELPAHQRAIEDFNKNYLFSYPSLEQKIVNLLSKELTD